MQQKDFEGRSLNPDNGLTAFANYMLWTSQQFSTIAISEIPDKLSELGTRVIRPGIPGISNPEDEIPYQYGQMTGREALAEIAGSVALELAGTTSYDPSARTAINMAGIAYATKRDWPMKPDSQGNYSLYSLQENHRAQFERDNPELFEALKADVQKLAEGKVGTYDKQLELIVNERQFIDDLATIQSLLDDGNYAQAWEEFKVLRERFYTERSRIFREIDIDEKEEPEDIGSNEHHMWRYRQLFDQATTTTPGGYVEFDVEHFGDLLEGLKEQWLNEGHDTAWDYVKQQQRLIEMKYPHDDDDPNTTSVKDMVEEIRLLSDRGWWKHLDTSVLLPLLRQAPGLEGKSVQIEEYLNGSRNQRADLLRKSNATYQPIENWYNRITDSKYGIVGRSRHDFIWAQENTDLRDILYKYNFNFPDKSVHEQNVLRAESRVPVLR